VLGRKAAQRKRIDSKAKTFCKMWLVIVIEPQMVLTLEHGKVYVCGINIAAGFAVWPVRAFFKNVLPTVWAFHFEPPSLAA
jgi:hypothetical protein